MYNIIHIRWQWTVESERPKLDTLLVEDLEFNPMSFVNQHFILSTPKKYSILLIYTHIQGLGEDCT